MRNVDLFFGIMEKIETSGYIFQHFRLIFGEFMDIACSLHKRNASVVSLRGCYSHPNVGQDIVDDF